MAKKDKLSKYRKAAKLAARDKHGQIDRESLPASVRETYDKLHRKYQRRTERARISNTDPKVYLHKYYPWSYRDYVPTLYLQGFYSVDYAKRRYLKIYGPDALKHVKFISGKDALEKEFAIGKNLYINGTWIKPKGLLSLPKDVRYRRNHKSYREKIKREIQAKKDAKQRERLLIAANDALTYGDETTYSRIEPEKRTRVQKVRKANEERKKNLYEE